MSEQRRRLPIIAIARDDGGMFTDGDWIESKDLSENGIRYLTTGNVGIGEFKDQGTGHISEATFQKLNCTEVLPGDILICRLNLPTGRACIVPDLGQKIVTSVDNVILRPSDDYDRRYLVYALSTKTYLEHASNLARGTTMKRISRSALGRIRMEIPPRAVQMQIADFLDFEIRRIDALVAEKNSFIALLREKRVAAISHAVIKGIDKNAPMKPSGQDWLGDVPAHWDVVPANWLFRPSKKLALPDDQLLSATQKYGVIPLAEFEKLEGRKVTLAVTNLEKRKHVEVGDFVISMRSMDGGLERARAQGSVRSSYIVLKFTNEVDGRFYEYLLKSKLFIQALRLTANFIRDGQDMHFGHFRAVKLPRLPLAEQDAIANHLDHETARIDGLIRETEHSIALLKEKRAALITATVTGKIDVRSAA